MAVFRLIERTNWLCVADQKRMPKRKVVAWRCGYNWKPQKGQNAKSLIEKIWQNFPRTGRVDNRKREVELRWKFFGFLILGEAYVPCGECWLGKFCTVRDCIKVFMLCYVIWPPASGWMEKRIEWDTFPNKRLHRIVQCPKHMTNKRIKQTFEQ